MSDSNFKSRAIEDIVIDREMRQRRELPDLGKLAASIAENGLINPIVIDENDVLVAGESRLTAVRDILGWTHIMTQLKSECSAAQLYLIELEENIARSDLDWRDHCHAVLNYHSMRLEEDPEWNRRKTADAMGVTPSEVSNRIDVAIALRDEVALVVAADRYTTARNIVSRNKARQKEAALDTIGFDAPADIPSTQGDTDTDPSQPTSTTTTAPTTAPQSPVASDLFADVDLTSSEKVIPFQHIDFADFVADYSGPKFNFIHCDFPYGVNANKHKMGASQEFGGYEDSPEVYWELLSTLADAMDNVVSDSAHMMFWFSMDFYTETKELLTDMGWKVNPFPLNWFKSDNSGIMPDPQRGPRRVTETAFFCSRGDKFVVQPVANTIPHPNTKEIHMSEKPRDMLQHFFRMFVDETTRMIDPTMGSGNAVIVAEQMGAAHAVGLERDETFFNNAVEKYREE